MNGRVSRHSRRSNYVYNPLQESITSTGYHRYSNNRILEGQRSTTPHFRKNRSQLEVSLTPERKKRSSIVNNPLLNATGDRKSISGYKIDRSHRLTSTPPLKSNNSYFRRNQEPNKLIIDRSSPVSRRGSNFNSRHSVSPSRIARSSTPQYINQSRNYPYGAQDSYLGSQRDQRLYNSRSDQRDSDFMNHSEIVGYKSPERSKSQSYFVNKGTRKADECNLI